MPKYRVSRYDFDLGVYEGKNAVVALYLYANEQGFKSAAEMAGAEDLSINDFLDSFSIERMPDENAE